MSTVTSADGTQIDFTATGTGPALVIVDGAMSYRAFSPTIRAIAQALSDQNTVYIYDRRGRGESGNAASYAVPAAQAVRAEVDDLAALIEHAGGRAAVLGFSSGAVLCLEAALAGVPVTSLALYEPPFVIADDRPPLPADYRARVQQAVADGRPGDAVALFLTAAAGMPEEYLEPMKADPSWAGMEQVAPTLANDAAVMGQTMSGDPTTLRRYAPISTTALVVHGGNSPAFLASAAKAITAVLPNARHQLLPDQDHDVAPQALAPVLADWLTTSGRA